MMLAMSLIHRRQGVLVIAMLAALLWTGESTNAADPSVLKISHPQPYQVVQRTGVTPRVGYALVVIRGEVDGPAGSGNALWEYRVTPVGAVQDTGWSPLVTQSQNGRFAAQARIAAGWFRLGIVLK